MYTQNVKKNNYMKNIIIIKMTEIQTVINSYSATFSSLQTFA